MPGAPFIRALSRMSGRVALAASLTNHAKMNSRNCEVSNGGLRVAVALLSSLKSIICRQVAEPKDFARSIQPKGNNILAESTLIKDNPIQKAAIMMRSRRAVRSELPGCALAIYAFIGS